MIAALSFLLSLGQSKFVPPYKVLLDALGVAEAKFMLGSQSTNVRIEKDILSVVAQGKENPLVLPDWMNIPMTQVQGSDIWVGRAILSDWRSLFFTYEVKDGERRISRVFWGPRAPHHEEAKGRLKGTIKEFKIPSVTLSEDRVITVYMPPGNPVGVPAVYAADGTAEGYARVLEPLILAKKVRPCAIIGVHNGGYRGDSKAPFDFAKDFRAKEYLKIYDPERYNQHLKFFADEVPKWAEHEFRLSTGRDNRIITGFSNGGAFALTAAVDRPEVFAASMAFSIAAHNPTEVEKDMVGKDLPHFYIVAGALESFSLGTERMAGILKKHGAKVDFNTYLTGHDWEMWKIAFGRYMTKALPAR